VLPVGEAEFIHGRIFERGGSRWRGHFGTLPPCLLVVARDFVLFDAATVSRLAESRSVINRRLPDQLSSVPLRRDNRYRHQGPRKIGIASGMRSHRSQKVTDQHYDVTAVPGSGRQWEQPRRETLRGKGDYQP
jgi:hypothetical protein